MNIEEFKNFINDYIKTNPDSWIGLHDTHHVGLSSKIESDGLNVSHSPYGRKSRHFKDENGKINALKNFKATMHHLSGEKEVKLYSLPKDPIIINIPSTFLDIFGYSLTNPFAFQNMCLFGIEQSPIPCENGFGFMNGDSIEVSNSEEATIRILPSYFIAGHIDINAGTFIENPKYFLNLSKEEQDKILLKNTEISRKIIEDESASE